MGLQKYNRYDLDSFEYGVGYTSRGIKFYFDLEDYEKIKTYTWLVDKQGYVRTELWVKAGRVTIKMHNLVLNYKYNRGQKIVDHINGNKTDNRKKNLRFATKSENALNSKIQKNNTSGVRGVHYNKASKKWESYLKLNGKKIYLGSSFSKEESIKVRLLGEKKYYGEDFSPQRSLFREYKI